MPVVGWAQLRGDRQLGGIFPTNYNLCKVKHVQRETWQFSVGHVQDIPSSNPNQQLTTDGYIEFIHY